ncbi:MAG: hypothetical protein R8K49_04995 [Mariprofundaceae bacterium]
MIAGDFKKITCIVHVGVAKQAMAILYEKFGIVESQFNFARGIGKRSHLATQGWDEHAEKEILSITVPAEQADEIFEHLFFEAKINKPHHGIIYMHSIHKATNYQLPEGMLLES